MPQKCILKSQRIQWSENLLFLVSAVARRLFGNSAAEDCQVFFFHHVSTVQSPSGLSEKVEWRKANVQMNGKVAYGIDDFRKVYLKIENKEIMHTAFEKLVASSIMTYCLIKMKRPYHEMNSLMRLLACVKCLFA